MTANDDLIWKALADPTRRQLLDLLRDRHQTTSELSAHFAPRLSRFAIMKHLQVLQQADLVVVRQQGRERWHSLNAVPLRHVYERWVSVYASDWAASLVQLKRAAEHDPSTYQEERAMKTLQIEQEVLIVAEPQQVFEALTTHIDAWWMQGYASPHSTFHLEPLAGGRFYEDFGPGKGSALYATVTYLEPGKKLLLTGAMAMRGPVLGTVRFDLESEAHGTRLKLSHHILGTIDDSDREIYTTGWQELLGQHLKRFVEQHQGYREV
ncbi:SRPBCC domain-containing protein [Ktedonobacter racemifer]|uniref:Transcriptional regulator, ArsR family n=1 Tax=Ktedonobacter racemifer DSM 44963 TaxID=485913 RepID=D6TZX6_KTERA|nr:SRPBCC domain-containing protein [Ktedonobacter racemifer]EFH82116.1 transcriptional regulator, ArsR family [Ktedonobacter racemifer DSM 44963]